MTESMIERVARAIYENISAGADDMESCIMAARAAIEAMREPTDAMVDIMSDVAIDGPGYVYFHPSMADCGALWTAGVNAALNEQVAR